MLSRGRRKNKRAQFEIVMAKAESENGISRLALCIQVQFEIATVVVEQKFGPNIAAGFVLKVVIKSLGKIHLYATEHLTIKTIDRLAIKHAALNIQIYTIGMPANKSAGNAVLGIELIKRSTDIPPVSRV